MPSSCHQCTGKNDETRPTRTVEKWKTLRHLVTDTERTASDLIAEAIDDLAAKYGEPKPPKAAPRPRTGPFINR
jgi:hypothetical protein